MSARPILFATLGALLACGQAAGQEPVDPIDALLRQAAPNAPDPSEPDTAAEGTVDSAPDVAAPAPRRLIPPRPRLSRPVYVGETGKSPDGPLGEADQAYDGRIRASMAAAQGYRGAWDGGWMLSAGGRDLYSLELNDRDGAVEGAWRDLRRAGALDASGFIDSAEAADGSLTLRFAGVVAVIRAEGGRWRGELTEAGRTEPVGLRRRLP